jgi:hypothetical protein
MVTNTHKRERENEKVRKRFCHWTYFEYYGALEGSAKHKSEVEKVYENASSLQSWTYIRIH